MAAALIAALLAAPAAALAGETAPVLTPERETTTARAFEKAEPFSRKRSYLCVSASTRWLYQARIGGLMLNLRLYTPMGDSIAFEECLGAASTPGEKDIRLTMRVQDWNDGTMLQMDQYAVDVLERVGVTQIYLVDKYMNIREKYDVAEIAAIRELFGLGSGEQLSLAGESRPVTVVSEDGVRRQATN